MASLFLGRDVTCQRAVKLLFVVRLCRGKRYCTESCLRADRAAQQAWALES